MNEPSVFEGPDGTLPKNTLHRIDYISGENYIYHRDIHNAYGLLMTRSTY
jgi:hypothetical protein